MNQNSSMLFQTRDTPKYLKGDRLTLVRLLSRCGIKSSVYPAAGKGSRLLFCLEDLSTLALAYWLFRSGLRIRAINGVLADGQVKKLLQRLASAERIRAEGKQVGFLVTWRNLPGRRTATQKVELEKDFAGVQQVLGRQQQHGFVVVPIGRLLTELADRIQN